MPICLIVKRGATEKYLGSYVYSFIEGTPIILVLHKFWTPTEKMQHLAPLW